MPELSVDAFAAVTDHLRSAVADGSWLILTDSPGYLDWLKSYRLGALLGGRLREVDTIYGTIPCIDARTGDRGEVAWLTLPGDFPFAEALHPLGVQVQPGRRVVVLSDGNHEVIERLLGSIIDNTARPSGDPAAN